MYTINYINNNCLILIYFLFPISADIIWVIALLPWCTFYAIFYYGEEEKTVGNKLMKAPNYKEVQLSNWVNEEPQPRYM